MCRKAGNRRFEFSYRLPTKLFRLSMELGPEMDSLRFLDGGNILQQLLHRLHLFFRPLIPFHYPEGH